MAAVSLDVIQSGSGSTEIHAQPNDVITLQLSETVHSNVLDVAIAAFDGITDVTKVAFAFSNAGGASQKLALAQSGSGSTTINAQKGDTITFELASVSQNSAMASTVARLQGLGNLLGITIALNASGGAS